MISLLSDGHHPDGSVQFWLAGLCHDVSAIVLSTGGVVLGLWAAGRPFGIVMCGLGVIALAGIVVNNNRVLIDTFNEISRPRVQRWTCCSQGWPCQVPAEWS